MAPQARPRPADSLFVAMPADGRGILAGKDRGRVLGLAREQLARGKIDAQLAACGWVVQDYAAMDFGAGRGIALREVPLKTGPCDYLLLVDRKAVGVVEAKKEGTTLSGIAEQAATHWGRLARWLGWITCCVRPGAGSSGATRASAVNVRATLRQPTHANPPQRAWPYLFGRAPARGRGYSPSGKAAGFVEVRPRRCAPARG